MASGHKRPMTFLALGRMSELFSPLRSTTASLQAVSRYGPIAFDSDGSLRGHLHTVKNPG